MTEEGLPFLIMFYHPDHPETKQTFRDRVMAEVPNEKGAIENKYSTEKRSFIFCL